MRRKPGANPEVGSSLFTFLDGLICTMGALIVVLVVMVHHGKLQVQAAREAASPPLEDDLEIQRSDLEWRIGLLRESRDKTLAQLDEGRQALGHLEDHARRLRAQLEEQDLAHDELEKTLSGEERENDQLQAQLAAAQARIAAARRELDEKRRSTGTRTDSYAIVPYHGQNQTRRRPIYIECRGDGVVFQPEGIVLTEDDFAGDMGPGNTLDRALRAAREHMIRTRGSKPGDDGMPYPLLLVRPDGIGAFLAARSAMGSWSSEFGYELIDQDWPIEFPPTDPALAMSMRQAVAEGRLSQAYLVRNAPRLMRHGERPSFETAPGGGGLVRADGSLVGDHAPQGRNGSRSLRPNWVGNGYQGDGLVGLDTQRPSRGSAGGDSLLGPRYANSTGNDLALAGSGGGAGGRGRAGALASSGAGFGGDGQGANGRGGKKTSPYAAALESLGQSAGAQGTRTQGAAGQGAGGEGGPAQGGSDQRAAGFASQKSGVGSDQIVGQGDYGQASFDQPGGAAGSGGSLKASNPRYPVQGGAAIRNSAQRNPQFPAVPPERRLPSSPGPHARYGYGPSADGLADAGDRSANDPEGGSGTSADGSSGPTSAPGPTNATGPTNGKGRTSGSTVRQSPSRPGGRSSRMAPTSSGSGNTGSASGSASSSNTAGAGSSLGSSASQPGQAGGMPMPTLDLSPPPQSVAQERGRNWANKSADDQQAKEAVVPIKLVCDADHLALVPERGSGREIRVIKLGERTADSVNELVDAVWDQVDSWGTAGRGNYWRPKLVLEIEPGGERRFEDLKALLKDSGFDIEGRPRTPPKPKPSWRDKLARKRPFQGYPRTRSQD